MKESLTSRERVLRAFNHIKADRVPIDYMSNPGIDQRLGTLPAFTGRQ